MMPNGCAMTSTSRVPGQCDAEACSYPFCDAERPGRIAIDRNAEAARAKIVREALIMIGRSIVRQKRAGVLLLELANTADDETLALLGRALR